VTVGVLNPEGVQPPKNRTNEKRAGVLMYDHIGSCLSQRALAREAGTAQSVVARIELEQTIPSFVTLTELLGGGRVRPRD
jgi:ribosome-binding protein aMBF1 (putative translation factor)